MAWSWSHTQAAYTQVQQNIEAKDRDWLEVVYAEWKAAEGDIHFHAELNEEKYNSALQEAKDLSNDILAEYIWERTSDYATCENGGFEAHCCPFGCGCHWVSFSDEEEEE